MRFTLRHCMELCTSGLARHGSLIHEVTPLPSLFNTQSHTNTRAFSQLFNPGIVLTDTQTYTLFLLTGSVGTSHLLQRGALFRVPSPAGRGNKFFLAIFIVMYLAFDI